MTPEQASTYRLKLGINMALNAGWCWSFFRGHRVVPSIAVAGALAASSADLARTAGAASPRAVHAVDQLRDCPHHGDLAQEQASLRVGLS